MARPISCDESDFELQEKTNVEVYEDYTSQTEEQIKIEERVNEYLETAHYLKEQELLVSIGYDTENVENFLCFA